MGIILTAHNFQAVSLPYFDLKEKEWAVCLKLAKAAGSISQALVNHLELNATYNVKVEQAAKIAEGIEAALDHWRDRMALPDGKPFVELPKYEELCRHFAKWARQTHGFSLYNHNRRDVRI